MVSVTLDGSTLAIELTGRDAFNMSVVWIRGKRIQIPVTDITSADVLEQTHRPTSVDKRATRNQLRCVTRKGPFLYLELRSGAAYDAIAVTVPDAPTLRDDIVVARGRARSGD